MATSDAKTVEEYLNALPDDRKEALSAVRKVILRNLPEGYQETMNWGMISYEIPLSRYPKTYNGQPLSYAALASQKNYMALYLMGVYGDPAREKWLRKSFEAAGKKLNMGKSCLKFRKLEDLPLNIVGEIISKVPVEKYLETYEKRKPNLKE